jgi:hypothetical protein
MRVPRRQFGTLFLISGVNDCVYSVIMRLRKEVTTITEIIILWCKEDLQAMSPELRQHFPGTPGCYWCGRFFKDGDSMSLASIHRDGHIAGNKWLCSSCVDKANKNEVETLWG